MKSEDLSMLRSYTECQQLASELGMTIEVGSIGIVVKFVHKEGNVARNIPRDSEVVVFNGDSLGTVRSFLLGIKTSKTTMSVTL